METALLAAICMVRNLSDIEVERVSLRGGAPDCDPKTDGRGRADAPRLLDFHQDEEGHWVAVLSCGHTQHLRHQPPWQSRPWVIDAQQRQAMIGRHFSCGWCTKEQNSDKE
ncbi:DUF3565 domain-containing protein [Pseudomonas sp. ZM23]|uniref:DUF3565 domain-containing protein n=1 Tax=Pseudomonas triclosanedens TaxID=2961893 RepID=A0ABY6ZV30_9PSED|nr:DUF3565 domain-containing protein [Pseudomonas triclosanedens]MCP8463211.1 DUF3565 domain-containing protein [Pseudomonas triclosanedens]MCP8469730.1 DUF3565 domain-containing protein [Pseudomonas triclosanedens]MCP8474012.1 DUF3565 domain-containing protein [Pseudomonas triclosanedens]WAI48590.1 DUF3565 domain-containing protein [Pseudomonas triclosanedens]